MNDFTFYGDSWDQYKYWETQDQKTLKRINALLDDIKRNGAMKGTGKPEKLKYRKGAYSRRIDFRSHGAGLESNYMLTDSLHLPFLHIHPADNPQNF